MRLANGTERLKHATTLSLDRDKCRTKGMSIPIARNLAAPAEVSVYF